MDWKTQPGLTIIYDGQCPFCAAYVRMLRLRASVGPVRLVDARSSAPEVAAARAAGLELDRGMAVAYAGRFSHGAEAMTALALLSTPSGAFNRLTALVFRSPRTARLVYPALAAGRRLALRALGRPPIA